MTSKERIINILKHKPVDRIGVFENYWDETYGKWVKEGHLKDGEDFNLHFDHDLQYFFPISLIAKFDFVNEIILETDETITYRNGNGAVLKKYKMHTSTPEHIDFLVKNKDDWERHIKPFLTIDEGRINFSEYRKIKKIAEENNKFFALSALNVFEYMVSICGHENLLMGMALEPEWVADMAMTYSNLLINLERILIEKEGEPDGFWYFEDLGYKEKPFMSPRMYEELILPGHKITFDFAHLYEKPTIMHSCGFVEPFIPYMIKAGLDCLQAMEVKAGMDVIRIFEKYGDSLTLMGGIDIRCMYANNKEDIDKELEAKIPKLKSGFSYVLHSDHSIPPNVEYETYKYFIKKGIELGTY